MWLGKSFSHVSVPFTGAQPASVVDQRQTMVLENDKKVKWTH